MHVCDNHNVMIEGMNITHFFYSNSMHSINLVGMAVDSFLRSGDQSCSPTVLIALIWHVIFTGKSPIICSEDEKIGNIIIMVSWKSCLSNIIQLWWITDTDKNNALQKHTAVAVYLKSQQLLPYAFALQNTTELFISTSMQLCFSIPNNANACFRMVIMSPKCFTDNHSPMYSWSLS